MSTCRQAMLAISAAMNVCCSKARRPLATMSMEAGYIKTYCGEREREAEREICGRYYY